jgi:hypothetical protein
MLLLLLLLLSASGCSQLVAAAPAAANPSHILVELHEQPSTLLCTDCPNIALLHYACQAHSTSRQAPEHALRHGAR